MLKRITILTLITLFVGCSEGEKPDLAYFFSKEWKMDEVYVDGTLNDIDTDFYRLILREDFTMTRINFDGSEKSGSWSFDNGFNQLVLFSDSQIPENYLIIDIQVRRLEIQAIQADNKVGSTEFRYILKPTRP